MAVKTTPINNTDLQFLDGQTVSFDEEAFDSFIRSQGVELQHFRALKCPVGQIDRDDVTRRPHEDHEGCSNGFIYVEAGTITAIYQGNTKDSRMMDIGRMDAATVQVTFPRFYDKAVDGCEGDKIPVLIAPYDRLYLKEDAGLEVVHWQDGQFHASGLDRLDFPVKRVSDLIDARGKRYKQDHDFTVVNGLIKWSLDSNPGIDPKSGKGVTYSIRYTYRPFFYISRMIHEVRVAQVQDDQSGDRVTMRMPQTALLQREYNFLSETSEAKKDAASARQQRVPASGQFGPR